MLRYADGDLAAFRALYQRHQRGLYRFVAWRSPRRDWVDEVAQETWIGLHQARARYVPSASFRTFLYQIARNRLVDLQRQSPLLADDAGPELESPAADMALESRQMNTALHRAIRALPGEQKEALVLQQFSGLSLEEIAALTEAPVETVKSRLRYAMRKLREQLAADVAAQEEQA
ncbi:RNA polymerase sigma-70 factor (ECF subfamily) [Duganella sp. 1224]|uniref:sigma-70 family RNA polymerase sigma factor n=1 Tax=Duganella sp. 1224 TaxID=2587052 RepID=UPI0017A27158|nr:sigma-70 family RNA polymerase sigma factor [Duganella sp. 1224]NYE60870.1 RNA polymerase sigma-70 factor (ECF subfamily) [Duganella sp. 1224]